MKGRMEFEELREMLLYRRIVKWEGNSITLDNGIEISIEETDHDCCAYASGEFKDVVLDAAITNVGDIKYEPWDTENDRWSCGEYGCNASVTIMHNRNVICEAVGGADAGNGGYYYSIASFVVKIPAVGVKVCHFVGSEDGERRSDD